MASPQQAIKASPSSPRYKKNNLQDSNGNTETVLPLHILPITRLTRQPEMPIGFGLAFSKMEMLKSIQSLHAISGNDTIRHGQQR
ncbi:hypothetical protein [Chromobacterium sinusclupearum]|uniref:hypothetical protein n=1 Tax=Chromobacterium sinusclupearum TaxID=2077146 RepID=UPI001304CA78|nr:hypothetical protein [Chromobacterium sinusclupearum]